MTASVAASRVGEQLAELLGSFRYSAVRLETRAEYGVTGDEALQYQRFLAGSVPDTDWFQPWADVIGAQTGAGKRVQRFRVMDEPPTDFQRFELHMAPLNTQVGEDIRYVSRSVAETLTLPGYDFWVLDSAVLLVLRFDHDGHLSRVITNTRPRVAQRHLHHLDAARHASIGHAAFCARLDGRPPTVSSGG